MNKPETPEAARALISGFDLRTYAVLAAEGGAIAPEYVDRAASQYGEFLLLCWANASWGQQGVVVPTELADAVWHRHILDTRRYRLACMELAGMYIDHDPTLQKGSTPFYAGVDHTRQLHRRLGLMLSLECESVTYSTGSICGSPQPEPPPPNAGASPVVQMH